MSESSKVFLDRLAGRLAGEIDIAVADAVETDLLAGAVIASGPTFVVDCAALTFIDASGVHAFEHVSDRSQKRIRLVHLSRGCREIFEALNLCEQFGIEPSRDTAEHLVGPVP